MTRFESILVRFAAIHAGGVLFFSFLFRIYLASGHRADLSMLAMSGIMGVAFDLSVAIYSFLPFMLILTFWPNRFAQSRGLGTLLRALLFIDLVAWLLLIAAEFAFYAEFKDRFNFIAVDYLVYTHEVLMNIWQSYPILPIVSAVLVFAFAVMIIGGRIFFREARFGSAAPAVRLRAVAVYFAAVGFAFLGVTEDRLLGHANAFEELVGKNGLYSLFAAYGKNEINFDRFYTTMDSKKASTIVHDVLETGHRLASVENEESDSIVRNIHEPLPMRKLNVVVVLMESLSARFMGAYGNREAITPHLDGLAQRGLFFDRIYATGTRTVRGIEAVVLSIPPTPGQSIVRRPAGTGIFNIGTPFRHEGYRTSFIYGGHSLFDNMGPFFSGNGFDVIDQSAFAAGESGFSNAWGVSDEDLFRKVIQISDSAAKSRKPFFHIVLTASNHRPYTYPEGRVKIAPGTGRNGAVQYSDFAIGQFLKEAQTKSWFDDTVFVFVADHNASVAGQNQIDPADYLIPLIFYSPKWIKSEVIHHLGSQIDLAPTLLELLSVSYQSRFFGAELQDDDPKRAFLATYQNVGYLTESQLTILEPNHRVKRLAWEGKKLTLSKDARIPSVADDSDSDLSNAVAFYKTASDWFSHHLLEEKRRISESINSRN